jgi:hypothetical protein
LASAFIFAITLPGWWPVATRLSTKGAARRGEFHEPHYFGPEAGLVELGPPDSGSWQTPAHRLAALGFSEKRRFALNKKR